MDRFLFVAIFLVLSCATITTQKKTVMFDLSHGQCQDTPPGHEYYTDIVPDYKALIEQAGASWQQNDSATITPDLLRNVDVLIMLSPLSKNLQKNISNTEQNAIINFIRQGGKVLLFIDEEHRVDLRKYGANEITKAFGIELGFDIEGISKNCGAVSFENEIFKKRREIPYSGARAIKGGIPASICLDGGYLHSSYVMLDNGGKLFVAADAMVEQLMGYPDGVRNTFNKLQTRWWGKDSRIFMQELVQWVLK